MWFSFFAVKVVLGSAFSIESRFEELLFALPKARQKRVWDGPRAQETLQLHDMTNHQH